MSLIPSSAPGPSHARNPRAVLSLPEKTSRCRAGVSLALAAVVSLAGLPAARADEASTAACLSSHEEAQVLMQKGKVLAARAALLACGKEACPRVVRSDCVSMYEDNEKNIPSVVVQAVGDEGDLIDVVVRVDGKPIANRLTGAPIEIDPGPHQFAFSTKGKSPIVQTVLVRAGEKNRPLTASWVTPKTEGSAETVEMERPVPALTYVFAGVGLLGAGGFAWFGTSGNSKKNDLGSCAPVCASSDVDAVRKDYLFANISLGVGAAGLVAAGIVYLTRPSRPKEAPKTGFVVVPDRDGAHAVWSGTF